MKRAQERESFGGFIVGLPLSCFSFKLWLSVPISLNAGRVAMRPRHFQRRSWRSHSRKRRRYERERWRWLCPLCSVRDWRGWTCSTCGWEWKTQSGAQEALQDLPKKEQAETRDTTMPIGNPCLAEQTRKIESPRVPIPKAVPVGA